MKQEEKRLAVTVSTYLIESEEHLQLTLRHVRQQLAIEALEQIYNGRWYNIRITETPPTSGERLMYERGYSQDPPMYRMELEIVPTTTKWIVRPSFRQEEPFEYNPMPRPGFVERIKRSLRWKAYEWRVARRRRREESK